ncbi:unnamed protein product [Rotaria sordida]|uniref:Uncharacterized protein n=1 Tax=Rotaria sordida TaxID=392033 RepID=A0A818VML9_9BILA|nr:unnamed protein product [Rotaria sordida]CAF3711586.1 unnamed protein product [Rotaria sordida]
MQQSKHSKHHNDYQHHHHHRHRHHHRSKRSSPIPINGDNTDQYLYHNGYHQTTIPTPIPLPLSPMIQCSAYFIHRLDLDNYTVNTLRQTVDRIVSGPKSKGLKVKLSLPDDGLIIDNIPDPNQSWMYRRSELLYFWYDSHYLNIVVIITNNRSSYHATGLYSASIFRLRGNESVQLFIQRAQEFFAHLSAFPMSKSSSKILPTQGISVDNWITDNGKIKRKDRTKHHSITRKEPDIELTRSLQTSPVRATSRTEFEPEKLKTTDSSLNLYNHRTFNETPMLNDAQIANLMKFDNNYNHINDNNILSPSNNNINNNNNISGDLVAVLIRELKELRTEIAELKFEARYTPVHTTMASPPFIFDGIKESLNSSPSFVKLRLHSDIDAETQTDFGLMNHQQQEFSNKNKTSITNTKKKERSNKTINRYISSNNIESNQQDPKLMNFSSTNGSSNGIISSSTTQDEYRTKTNLLKPRGLLRPSENGHTHSNNSISSKIFDKNQIISNSIEEDSSLKMTSVTVEKEIPKLFPTKVYSAPIDGKSSLTIKHSDITNFRPSLIGTVTHPEHFYENIPISIKTDSNQNFFINGNNQKEKTSQLYVNITNDPNTELQQQYLTQLFGTQRGLSLLLQRQSTSSNSPSLSEEDNSIIQDTTSNNHQYGQPVVFANYLTNPLFNVDKELLANTIANQFGVDYNSPYLSQLIANQHLFVTDKRTFANMIWQITPEEEEALCASPITIASNIIIKNTYDSNNSIAKSILKSNRHSRSISKKSRITWDNTLE